MVSVSFAWFCMGSDLGFIDGDGGDLKVRDSFCGGRLGDCGILKSMNGFS